MHAIHLLWRNVVSACIVTLLFACTSRAQSVHFQLSNNSSNATTVIGQFTPTEYIPAFSSLIVTLAGLHVFPGDMISIQASVSVPDQSGRKMRIEEFSNIGPVVNGAYESALTNNVNFKNNNPSSRDWTSDLRFPQVDPPDTLYGRRITGAFCPTISGEYKMVLVDVDDFASLWIARPDPNAPGSLQPFQEIIKETLGGDFASRRPVIRPYTMDAYKVYSFITLFAEGSGLTQMNFNWIKPGESVPSIIPSDAFCTGWSHLHGGVLRVLFAFFLLPNAQVTFTIQTLPNPLCPRPVSAQLASAIQVPQYAGVLNSVSGFIQSSASGSYPATSHGDNVCKLGVGFSVSDITAASTAVFGRFTPTQYIPAFSTLVVTLTGTDVLPAGIISLPVNIQVSNQQVGGNNLRVEKFILSNASPFREKMLADLNYQSNNPHSTSFSSLIGHSQTNPGEDNFVKRWTGAFCPTISGDYEFVLEEVDDHFELHIAEQTSNSFTQV
jgi:hypothetical protein